MMLKYTEIILRLNLLEQRAFFFTRKTKINLTKGYITGDERGKRYVSNTKMMVQSSKEHNIHYAPQLSYDSKNIS